MLRASVDFICKLCNQSKNWYIMPLKKKAGNSYIRSLTQYQIICKKCKKEYILQIKIKAV